MIITQRSIRVVAVRLHTPVGRRCWNYSTKVGQDAAHPQLCERCLPVIRGMGFEIPPSNGVLAPAEAAAVPS